MPSLTPFLGAIIAGAIAAFALTLALAALGGWHGAVGGIALATGRRDRSHIRDCKCRSGSLSCSGCRPRWVDIWQDASGGALCRRLKTRAISAIPRMDFWRGRSPPWWLRFWSDRIVAEYRDIGRCICREVGSGWSDVGSNDSWALNRAGLPSRQPIMSICFFGPARTLPQPQQLNRILNRSVSIQAEATGILTTGSCDRQSVAS